MYKNKQWRPSFSIGFHFLFPSFRILSTLLVMINRETNPLRVANLNALFCCFLLASMVLYTLLNVSGNNHRSDNDFISDRFFCNNYPHAFSSTPWLYLTHHKYDIAIAELYLLCVLRSDLCFIRSHCTELSLLVSEQCWVVMMDIHPSLPPEQSSFADIDSQTIATFDVNTCIWPEHVAFH